MTRRKLVALVSAFVLLGFGLIALGVGLFFTQTTMGRDRLRDFALPVIRRAVPGASLYVGHIGGNLLTGITIDTVAIRDKRGELFISTGRLTLAYNPRDLIDYRVYILHAEVEHPYVHLIQHENGVWNFNEIFASNNKKPSRTAQLNTRGIGDYIVIDSTRTREASFALTMPWHPDDTLHGAVRDSVIRAVLANSQKPVEKTAEGYQKTWAWTNIHGLITHVRIADPDSDKKFGRQFNVGELAVEEHDPPFNFTHVHGDVRLLGDSLWLNVPHFDLPASTGKGTGKILWGSDLPVRYDLAIHSDSVALNDVNWVYPNLPRSGGGSVDLTIKNDPKNLDVIDYRLAKMDVKTTRSHVTGTMTFGVGAPVLEVSNLDLRADPIDFAFLKTLNGKPFPEDWEGQLEGTVRGRGGPLTHFYVDDARGTFADANVRGAVSRFSGKGELDILDPAYTAFHDFYVDASSVDLRSIEYLFPAFLPLHGFVSGTATLDSSWLDVRVRDANLTHQDGPGDPSHVTGGGRITWGDKLMTYDLAFDAEPLSLTMLARSFPAMPLRGTMSGPVTLKGQTPDLALSLSLQGAAGAFSYDGRADLDSAGGYGFHGHGQFSALALSKLLEKSSVPVGLLSGHYDLDATGSSAATLNGTAELNLERTSFDSIRVNPSYAKLHFADGRAHVDSLRINSSAATITATGGIGLPKGSSDTLRFVAVVDSLGGLRPFLATHDTALAGEPVIDSLSGSFRIDGEAIGRLDALTLGGHVSGNDIVWNNQSTTALDGVISISDVTNTFRGSVRARLDTVTLAAVQLDTLGVRVDFDDLRHRRFAVSARSLTGPTLAATGAWNSTGSNQFISLDTAAFDLGTGQWRLANPAHLAIDTTGVQLDSLVLRNRGDAFIRLAGSVPDSGLAFAQLRAVHVPLQDISTLAQLRDTIGGLAELTITAGGTKGKPHISGDVALFGAKWAGVTFDTVRAHSLYDNRRANVDVAVQRGGRQTLTATGSAPIELTLFSRRFIDDSVSGSIDANNADLAVIQAPLDRVVKDVSGSFTAHVRAAGTTRAPVFAGRLDVHADTATLIAAGVKVRNVNVHADGGTDRAKSADSLRIRATAYGVGSQPRDTAVVYGTVRNLWQSKGTPQLAFVARANSFHAFEKRSLADLYVSTVSRDVNGALVPDSLMLTGPLDGAMLSGSLFVDHTLIFLQDPDLARKQVVDLASDTTLGGANTPAASRSTTLLNNLQADVPVYVGSDVHLHSREADVRLTGDLALQKSAVGLEPGAGSLASGLQLEGALTTAGGKYTLNLGLVQRDFDVLPGGTVTFDGPYSDPLLNIAAQYNVTQYHDQDLGVIIHLRGRLALPQIDFASNADYDISQSDLLSYLLIGKPGFDFGANPQASQVLASVLGPTLSAIAANSLSRSFGSAFDAVNLQFGSANQTTGQNSNSSQFQQFLTGASIGVEKQVGGKLFVSASTGLCQLADPSKGGSQSGLSLLGAVGAKAEYRVTPDLSLQVGRDPPTSARFCSSDLGATGLYPTPQNWSLGVSHSWRW